MTEAIAREKKPEGVDTRDAFMLRLLQALRWMEHNRRLAAVIGLLLVAVALGAFYYAGYRRSLNEQAAARLQQLRLGVGAQSPAASRDALITFLARYGETRSADDARILLAQLELQRDSVEAAIQLLLPVAEGQGGSPTAYAAARMLAAAHEQAGRPEEALRWYRVIADRARFDFQKRRARDDQARILAATGRLVEAERIYAELLEETSGKAGTALPEGLWGVRLGEIRALRETGGGDPSPTPPASGGAACASEVPEASKAVPPTPSAEGSESSRAGESPAPDNPEAISSLHSPDGDADPAPSRAPAPADPSGRP
ncbi:MAG: tetratricopeptide repeat protein [Gemmatimonadota bacterium]